jgi:chemosensory pili system protein ChpA (sensor histidine kinase/response regulator)
MSQDKEREIQLQFLEEAQEYLDTIESVLLDLGGSHIEAHQMDAVLRAAHSVKGGAGMMGYQTLSQLAHRLEDSFKVMKAQRNSIEVDGSLESLLLAAVDRLRQVLQKNRQSTDVDEQWLETEGNPVFEKLHERLGDPVADDAATMLGSDDGTNVAALLFETEVEGCLNRLEAVLADSALPCLEEELSIMAQELGGLGEMLQLDAFTQLCESVIQCLESAPLSVFEIAKSALSSWRRSQALVLVGQVSSLPTSINFVVEDVVRPADSRPTATEVVENWLPDSLVAEFDFYTKQASDKGIEEDQNAARLSDLVEEEADAIDEEAIVSHKSEIEFLHPTPTDAVENENLEVLAAEFDLYSSHSTARSTSESLEEDLSALNSYEELQEIGQTSSQPVEYEPTAKGTADNFHTDATDSSFEATPEEAIALSSTQGDVDSVPPISVVRRREQEAARVPGKEKVRASSTTANVGQENSVRIPVRQLDRLNDLFGELTIERNGLSLHLGRLRSLIETLGQRVSTLEQSNMRLRTAYDTVATSAVVQETGDWKRGNGERGAEYKRSLRAFLPQPERSYLNTLGDNSGSGAGRSSHLGDGTLNINSRFDALEMDRYSDLHLLSMEVMETIVQVQEVTSDIGLALEDTDSTARELNQTAKQLQTNLTRIRMRPLSDLVGRFSRALRDLSLQYGKLVELKVYGKGTLIDRSILEALSDPLMHLVRNAFDHGIEDPTTRQQEGKPRSAVIEIKAAHRGNQTIISVSDDGNGINLNKIRARAEAMGLDAGLLAAASEDELLSLIFEPGFSTADKVTALSGRGVGMDVVRNNLKLIRGDIRVDTAPGRGTTFTLTVPFTLSVARVLLVESNGMLLAFPTDVIEEMLLLHPEQVLTTPGSEVLNWEGEMVPLTRLGTWLKFYCPRRHSVLEGVPSISKPTVLMISQGDQLQGLQVDRCWGEREVAIRQVEGAMEMPPGMSSACVLGDGKVVPLVDVGELLRWIASCSRKGDAGRGAQEDWGLANANSHHQKANVAPTTFIESAQASAYPNSVPNTQSLVPSFQQVSEVTEKDIILVVDDSINVRRFLALALEKAGYLVEQAKDGQDAVEKLLGGLHCCAVICDIEMPRLDGYGFLARIKSEPAFDDLPIAMLTSRTGDKHRQLAMTLGAAAYFSKPYNEQELLRTMKQLITSSGAYSPQPVLSHEF